MKGSKPGYHFGASHQKPHLSTKLASDILRYLREANPGVDLNRICETAGLSPGYIFDEDKWLSIESFKRLVEVVSSLNQDEDFHFKAGQFALKNPTGGKTVKFIARNVIPMRLVYSLLPKLASLFSQVSKTSIVSHKNGKLRIKLEPDVHKQNLDKMEIISLYEIFDLIFYNTLGYYTAVPLNYDYPPAQASFEKQIGENNAPCYEIELTYPAVRTFNKSLGFYLLIGVAFLLTLISFLFNYVSVMPFIIVTLLMGVIFFTIDLSRTKDRLKERFDASISALEAYDQRYTKLHQAHMDKEQLLVSYKKFVPFEYLEFLKVNDIFNLERGRAVQEDASLLFCDIRGFTTMSEKMSPKENFEFLNRYFEFVAPIIRQEGGFIDKYIGDELLAIFPPTRGRAVFAGIEIQRTINRFNIDQEKRGFPPVNVGIGISTGQVMIGTLGVEEHMQVTVISDTVNTASRLQELTKQFQTSTIVCGSSINRAKGEDSVLAYRYLGEFTLRGKDRPIQAFEVFHEAESQTATRAVLNRKLTDAGISLIEQGQLDIARQVFQEAREKNPNDPLVNFYLSLIDQKLNRIGLVPLSEKKKES